MYLICVFFDHGKTSFVKLVPQRSRTIQLNNEFSQYLRFKKNFVTSRISGFCFKSNKCRKLMNPESFCSVSNMIIVIAACDLMRHFILSITYPEVFLFNVCTIYNINIIFRCICVFSKRQIVFYLD